MLALFMSFSLFVIRSFYLLPKVRESRKNSGILDQSGKVKESNILVKSRRKDWEIKNARQTASE